MADERASGWSFPVERYPDPVCRYTLADGTPVLGAADTDFEAQFDAVPSGTPIREAFESLGVTTVDVDDLERALADGERFTVLATPDASATARRYFVQTIPPEDGAVGVLVFTEAGAEGAVDSMLGVDHVASVVSHDLRNPLDVAKTRLRAGRELDEDEHFDHVEQAHDRMERIIQDVLTLARGEDVVEPDEPVDLGAVAERAWETVETDDATLTVADPLPTAVADPDRVGRLFENLFRNSVEHGSQVYRDASEHDGPDSGGVTVTVGRLSDGFYVADDGPGIPAAERDRVFEPGYSSEDHGTGLGLAIVARIADLHGWSSTVTAATDGGARFEIRGVEPVADPS